MIDIGVYPRLCTVSPVFIKYACLLKRGFPDLTAEAWEEITSAAYVPFAEPILSTKDILSVGTC